MVGFSGTNPLEKKPPKKTETQVKKVVSVADARKNKMPANLAKAKAAAFEIEKKNRIQAAANQAMASGGAIKSVISKCNTLPSLQNPVPVQKPMSDAMQVLILFD